MANIDPYLENIMQARYGRDVRQSIHDGIEAINDDTIARNAENKAIAENAVDLATQAKGEAKTAQDSAQAYANQALAHEQQAQIYRNQAEQFKDEAFSGTPEGYEDVVAKVNSLKEHTGTYLAEVGTKEGSALAKIIYGMSVQDGTPTPSVPVEIQSAKADFKCVGKNLINPTLGELTLNGVTCKQKGDGTYVLNGTHTSSLSQFYLQQNLKVKKGQYRYVGTKGGSNSTWKSGIYIGPNQYYDDFGNGVNINFTEDTTVIIRIVIYGATVFNDVTFKPMLTPDLSATYDDYEPYKETKVTTDLTLRAIEVASTDNYTYERDGKYYIADTIDWSEDKGYEITRRIARQVGGVVEWFGSRDNSKQININLELPIHTEYLIAKMNRFVQDSTHSSRAGTFWFATSRTVLCVFLPTSVDITSIQSAQTWIDNNPTEIVYTLATPTTEPIISEQAQALLSLKTYDEATSISATGDIEPSLDLEYSKDRNTALALTGHNLAHKNALKLNDINTALIELGGN